MVEECLRFAIWVALPIPKSYSRTLRTPGSSMQAASKEKAPAPAEKFETRMRTKTKSNTHEWTFESRSKQTWASASRA